MYFGYCCHFAAWPVGQRKIEMDEIEKREKENNIAKIRRQRQKQYRTYDSQLCGVLFVSCTNSPLFIWHSSAFFHLNSLSNRLCLLALMPDAFNELKWNEMKTHNKCFNKIKIRMFFYLINEIIFFCANLCVCAFAVHEVHCPLDEISF